MVQSPERAKRDRTRMVARVTYEKQEFRASVLDLGEAGMCLYFSTDLEIRIGRPVDVATDEMGLIGGTVRWVRGPRVGVQLHLSSNTQAKVESFYKFYADTHIRN